jgi:hypothetical protein
MTSWLAEWIKNNQILLDAVKMTYQSFGILAFTLLKQGVNATIINKRVSRYNLEVD